MIFVDTSFWIALRDGSDDRHDRAVQLLGEHRREELVTSDQVRGEAWTFLRRRAGDRVAVALLDALSDSTRVHLVSVSEGLASEALTWLRKHDERPYSFIDATSFAVMRSLGIERALSFDEDFTVAGFATLA